MNTHLAAAACRSGTWLQRWKCGWDQPTTGAGHAGYMSGHNVLPALLVLAVILLAVRAVRKRRVRSSPAATGPARARAGAGRS
jgi:hypothetical protein